MNKMYPLTSEVAWKVLTMIQSYIANDSLAELKLILRDTVIENSVGAYYVKDINITHKNDYKNISIGDVSFQMTNVMNPSQSHICTLADIANDRYRVIKVISDAEEFSSSIRSRIDFSGNFDQLLGCIVFDKDYGFGFIATIADNSEVYGVQYQYGGFRELIGLRVTDMKTIIFNVKVNGFVDMLEIIR